MGQLSQELGEMEAWHAPSSQGLHPGPSTLCSRSPSSCPMETGRLKPRFFFQDLFIGMLELQRGTQTLHLLAHSHVSVCVRVCACETPAGQLGLEFMPMQEARVGGVGAPCHAGPTPKGSPGQTFLQYLRPAHPHPPSFWQLGLPCSWLPCDTVTLGHEIGAGV